MFISLAYCVIEKPQPCRRPIPCRTNMANNVIFKVYPIKKINDAIFDWQGWYGSVQLQRRGLFEFRVGATAVPTIAALSATQREGCKLHQFWLKGKEFPRLTWIFSIQQFWLLLDTSISTEESMTTFRCFTNELNKNDEGCSVVSSVRQLKLEMTYCN